VRNIEHRDTVDRHGVARTTLDRANEFYVHHTNASPQGLPSRSRSGHPAAESWQVGTVML